MRATLILAAMLVAVPAQAKPWNCVLWPKQCVEPTPVLEPARVEPAPVPVPRPVEALPAATRLDAPPAKAKPLPRIIRPKYKPAPAKARRAARVAIPWWCIGVPAGTSITRMQTEAKSRGIAWTPQASQQARACLASK